MQAPLDSSATAWFAGHVSTPVVIPMSRDGRQRLAFSLESGTGWAMFYEGPEARVHVVLRFGWGEVPAYVRPPAVVRALYLRSVGGLRELNAATLRRLPLGRIDAAVNRPSVQHLVEVALPPHDEDYAKAIYEPVPDGRHFGLSRAVPVKGPVLRMEQPTAVRRPDVFYTDVADRFLWLLSIGEQPAQQLAEANGVPISTVHRWVKEARVRRLLPASGRRAIGENEQQQKRWPEEETEQGS